MQEFILILSRCLALRHSPKSQKRYYRFHFKGVYAGEKISEIHLYNSAKKSPLLEEQLTKGEDYLLWVKHKNINKGILEVELIASKKIS